MAISEFAFVLLEAKKYDELWRYVLPHASAGDSSAQCLMGYLCEHGLGVATDVDEAERWLYQAAQPRNVFSSQG